MNEMLLLLLLPSSSSKREFQERVSPVEGGWTAFYSQAGVSGEEAEVAVPSGSLSLSPC